MYLYVNRRFVKDYLLNHAVMTAYRRLIEARRYPAVILGLEIAPGDVDVNVHPAKMEVRFRNPREIYALIVETLGGAIGAGLTPAGGGCGGIVRRRAGRVCLPDRRGLEAVPGLLRTGKTVLRRSVDRKKRSAGESRRLCLRRR